MKKEKWKGKVREEHMWREKPIPISKSEKNPQPERRAVKRVYTAIPLTINLVGEGGAPPPITVQTTNISPQGLSTLIKIRIKKNDGRISIHEEIKNSAKMVRYLLMEDKILGLGIHILPQGKSVNTMGTVKWYARSLNEGLYTVRAGIFLDEIDRADKKEWFDFLRSIYDFLACFYREGGKGRDSIITPLYPG
jgi:hypothetical protein